MRTAGWQRLLWLAPLAGVLGVLAGCAAEPRRPAVAFTNEEWPFGRTTGRKLTTDHYELYTTLTDPVLIDALPDFVERAHARCRALIPPVKEPDGRMRIYLFATRSQWEAFTRKFTGERAETFLKVRNGGYSERGVTVIEYVSHAVTFPLLAHEGFHQYLYHHVGENVPPWLNEGLAVWCEGQRWGMYALKDFDPWYNPSRKNQLIESLQGGHLHPLSRLLETHAGRIIEGSSRSVLTYYAQVWALVLFLQEGEGGKYAAGFHRLLAALGRPELEEQARAGFIWSDEAEFNFGEAIFRAYIRDDIAAVEREYVNFIRARFLP